MRQLRTYRSAAWGAGALALVAACKKPVPAEVPSPIEHPVIYSGCVVTRVGPVCEVGKDKPLHVWLPDGERAERFAVDGKVIASKAEEGVAGGTLYELSVAMPAHELSMIAVAGGKKKSWSLKVAEETPLPPKLAEAEKVYRAGDPETAAKMLREMIATATGDERCLAVAKLGNVEASRDRVDEAKPLLEEGIACDEAAGRISSAVNDSFSLVHSHIVAWRFAEARLELARGARLAGDYPEVASMVAYYEERIALETGDTRRVLQLARSTEDGYRRVARPASVSRAVLIHAQGLSGAGRPGDALALLRREAGRANEGALDRASRLTEEGWALLLAMDLGVGSEDPQATLEEASALHHRLGNGEVEASSLVAAARAALRAGNLGAARGRIMRAKEAIAHPPPEALLDRLFAEAEVELASGAAARALQLFDELAVEAREFGQANKSWMAAEGRGRALLRLGRRRAALEAFSDAEEKLSEASRAVPLGEGRAAYLAARETSARQRVGALVDVDPAAAFEAAREARARIVTDAQLSDRVARLSLTERTVFEEKLGAYRRAREQLDTSLERDWSLDSAALATASAVRRAKQTELRAAYEAALASLPQSVRATRRKPQGGALWLAYFPTEVGWVGFAATGAGVRAARLERVSSGASPEALASALFDPFATEIGRAELIALLPYGTLSRIDIHAIPFRGKPLVASVPVEYELDLGPSAAREDAHGALVVADPRGDLPEARDEVAALYRLLSPRGEVTRLQGAEATREAVEDGLSRAALFHYAGHGTFAGHDGWDSALLLAGENQLAVGDILSLARVPRTVVLSGCETGRATRADGGGVLSTDGLGLAQAFLVAGANVAIAATRDVRDEDARLIMAGFYESLAAGEDPPRALRDAQRAVFGRNADWSAFRVVRR